MWIAIGFSKSLVAEGDAKLSGCLLHYCVESLQIPLSKQLLKSKQEVDDGG
jgi:hypothetical protein